MSSTASTALKLDHLKPPTPEKMKLHRGSALDRVDALATGESRGAGSLRFYILLGMGGVIFSFAKFLGLF